MALSSFGLTAPMTKVPEPNRTRSNLLCETDITKSHFAQFSRCADGNGGLCSRMWYAQTAVGAFVLSGTIVDSCRRCTAEMTTTGRTFHISGATVPRKSHMSTIPGAG